MLHRARPKAVSYSALVTPKQKEELDAVAALNAAEGLGLSGLQPVVPDPPDIEGMLRGRRIGIEVRKLLEKDEAKSADLRRNVVQKNLAQLLSNEGPGEIDVRLQGCDLANLGNAGLRALERKLANVGRQLAGFVVAPGSAAVALASWAQTWPQDGKWPAGHTFVPLLVPAGVVWVCFTRTGSGGLISQISSQILRHTEWPPETLTDAVAAKRADLKNWPPLYAERWLVLPVGNWSRVTVLLAGTNPGGFQNTGFDRIYITQWFGGLTGPQRLESVRLDL